MGWLHISTKPVEFLIYGSLTEKTFNPSLLLNIYSKQIEFIVIAPANKY